MLFVALSYSQRWSAYGIKVSPQNEEALVKVMNDYFSENPIEGVTVTLYSVMFTPADLNFTHEIIFNGEPEAMAKIYMEFLKVCQNKWNIKWYCSNA